jgi:hypothetical protein
VAIRQVVTVGPGSDACVGWCSLIACVIAARWDPEVLDVQFACKGAPMGETRIRGAKVYISENRHVRRRIASVSHFPCRTMAATAPTANGIRRLNRCLCMLCARVSEPTVWSQSSATPHADPAAGRMKSVLWIPEPALAPYPVLICPASIREGILPGPDHHPNLATQV